MNTEQQLHRAAEDMERATASLTPPPIADVRRGARIRAAGVAVAAAVGVAVIVGGAVLLLRPPGETTLAPAGPGETTVAVEITTTERAPDNAVEFAPLDAEPRFDLAGALEVPLLDIGSEDVALDIAQLRLEAGPEARDGELEFLALGAGDVDHVYVVKGMRASGAGIGFDCLFTGSGADWRELWCGDDNTRGIDPSVSRLGDAQQVAVTGRAPQGSSVVVLELGDERYWQRTRDGYVHLAVAATDDDPARFFVYDADGNVLDGWSFYNPSGPGSETTGTTVTVTVPATDIESCSGSGVYPSVLARSDLPQPVAATLFNIVEAASICDFETLAGISADFFTASFGGGDPAELWAYEEELGYEPMYHLMKILDMPNGTTQVDDRTLYIWPAAAAHDGDWTTVPEEDKAALRTLYDDEDFAGFESFGAYIGYRLGIYEDGDWSFFVAGD